MLKRTLLISFAALFCEIAIGQPILNSTYFPETGKAFSGRSFTRLTPLEIQIGSNLNWDLTPLEANYITNYNFAFRVKPVAGAQGASLFPGAQQVLMSYFGEDSIENFHKVTGNDLQRLGSKIKDIDWTEVNSDPRVEFESGHDFQEYRFRESNYLEQLPQGAPAQYFKVLDTVQYAGYGTVVTTFGTYTNIPLITRRACRYFSDSPGGNYSPYEYIRTWNWYLPGFGTPYIQYSETIVAIEPDNVSYGGYVGFVPAPVSAAESIAGEVISLYPTVVSGGQNVFLQGISGQEPTYYQIFDVAGRNVLSSKTDQSSFQVPALKPGMYQVVMKDLNRLYHQKMMVR